MIKKKLEILRNAEVIDQQTEEFVWTIRNYLLEKEVITDEADMDMFLTHLAMADMRQKKNDEPLKMDELIQKEVESNPKLEESKALWKELETHASTVFSTDELWFIYMHIITILTKE